jgi:hypothetical protein
LKMRYFYLFDRPVQLFHPPLHQLTDVEPIKNAIL